MEAFATKAQYDARFPGRTATDSVLEECLEDATAAIMAALDSRGVSYDDPSEEFADKLMRVCRSVANRLLPAGSDVPAGVTQASMSAVGFSESYTFGTSYGTAKLLPSELKMLGIGGGGVGWARLGGSDVQDS